MDDTSGSGLDLLQHLRPFAEQVEVAVRDLEVRICRIEVQSLSSSQDRDTEDAKHVGRYASQHDDDDDDDDEERDEEDKNKEDIERESGDRYDVKELSRLQATTKFATGGYLTGQTTNGSDNFQFGTQGSTASSAGSTSIPIVMGNSNNVLQHANLDNQVIQRLEGEISLVSEQGTSLSKQISRMAESQEASRTEIEMLQKKMSTTRQATKKLQDSLSGTTAKLHDLIQRVETLEAPNPQTKAENVTVLEHPLDADVRDSQTSLLSACTSVTDSSNYQSRLSLLEHAVFGNVSASQEKLTKQNSTSLSELVSRMQKIEEAVNNNNGSSLYTETIGQTRELILNEGKSSEAAELKDDECTLIWKAIKAEATARLSLLEKFQVLESKLNSVRTSSGARQMSTIAACNNGTSSNGSRPTSVESDDSGKVNKASSVNALAPIVGRNKSSSQLSSKSDHKISKRQVTSNSNPSEKNAPSFAKKQAFGTPIPSKAFNPAPSINNSFKPSPSTKLVLYPSPPMVVIDPIKQYTVKGTRVDSLSPSPPSQRSDESRKRNANGDQQKDADDNATQISIAESDCYPENDAVGLRRLRALRSRKNQVGFESNEISLKKEEEPLSDSQQKLQTHQSALAVTLHMNKENISQTSSAVHMPPSKMMRPSSQSNVSRTLKQRSGSNSSQIDEDDQNPRRRLFKERNVNDSNISNGMFMPNPPKTAQPSSNRRRR